MSLRSLAVRPGQLGAGFRQRLLPGGDRVAGQVTLHLCSQTFASESLRRRRLQLVFAARGSKTEVSNEVVRYAPGGSAAARAELHRVATSCPSGPQPSPVRDQQGIASRIRPVHFARTLPDTLALEDRESKDRRHATQFVVYQFSGNYLSVVYGQGNDLHAQRALVATAAAAVASNLTHAHH